MSTQEQRERFEVWARSENYPLGCDGTNGSDYIDAATSCAYMGWLAAEAAAIERCAKALCHQLLVRGTMDIGEACLMLRVVGSCPSDEDFESAIRALLPKED